MSYNKTTQVDSMKGIKGTFYDKDGKTMTVTADEGEVRLDTKNVVLTKNPKGSTSDGGTVTADKITWVNQDQTVVAEGNARLTKGDTVATGEKATFDVPMNHATLEKNANVQKGEF
jgi:LPS export ABC transporter protein LptC